jgi:hypothetical protein
MDRLSHMSGFSRWSIDRRDGHYLTELAAERQQGKLVYLTSESEEVLQVRCCGLRNLVSDQSSISYK